MMLHFETMGFGEVAKFGGIKQDRQYYLRQQGLKDTIYANYKEG